jgi:hypothetical protein
MLMQTVADAEAPADTGSGTPLRIDNDRLRLLIGVNGLLLPFVLVTAVVIRPSTGLDTLLNSLSAYYYTSGIALLEGLLVTLALFLFVYRGYQNKYGWADRLCARVAGGAALLIALCPTYPPGYPQALVAPASWWTEKAGKIHDWSSAVMFVTFAVFSLWLFRETDPRLAMTPGKRLRNHVYFVCGLLIVGAVAWVVYLSKTSSDARILVPESIAIGAFAFSWLVKGGALARWLPN